MRELNSSEVKFVFLGGTLAIVLEWFSTFQNVFCVVYERFYITLTFRASLGVQVVTIDFDLELVIGGIAVLDLEKLPG